jgi:hypothetical protein
VGGTEGDDERPRAEYVEGSARQHRQQDRQRHVLARVACLFSEWGRGFKTAEGPDGPTEGEQGALAAAGPLEGRRGDALGTAVDEEGQAHYEEQHRLEDVEHVGHPHAELQPDGDRCRHQHAVDDRHDLGEAPEQALAGYTTNAAVAIGEAEVAGMLRPGYWADFVAWAQDPVKCPAGRARVAGYSHSRLIPRRGLRRSERGMPS